MSLILDALRKSAGERQRGQSPTLASSVGLTPRRRAHPARMPVALALLAGTAGAGWWLGFGGASAPEALADRGNDADPALASGVPAVANLPAEDTALADAPALADSAPELRPEAVQLPLDDLSPQIGESQSRMTGGVVAGGGAAALPLPAGTVYTPETMTATTETPPVPAAATATLPESAAQPAPVSAAPSAPVAAAVATPEPQPAPAPAEPVQRLSTIDELDYAIRRELPPLDISMYVYNADPARRFVIIGGKRYPRVDGSGQKVSRIEDKVDLVEIRADGVVLEFQSQRFLLPRGR